MTCERRAALPIASIADDAAGAAVGVARREEWNRAATACVVVAIFPVVAIGANTRRHAFAGIADPVGVTKVRRGFAGRAVRCGCATSWRGIGTRVIWRDVRFDLDVDIRSIERQHSPTVVRTCFWRRIDSRRARSCGAREVRAQCTHQQNAATRTKREYGPQRAQPRNHHPPRSCHSSRLTPKSLLFYSLSVGYLLLSWLTLCPWNYSSLTSSNSSDAPPLISPATSRLRSRDHATPRGR